MPPHTHRPPPRAITRVCNTSIALLKKSINHFSFRFVELLLSGSRSDAFNSYISKGSSGFTMAGLRFMYRSTSKTFLLSASDRYLYLGCFVISNLSLKNGRTPRSCKIHLPPSMTAISSWVINSLPQCQVMN